MMTRPSANLNPMYCMMIFHLRYETSNRESFPVIVSLAPSLLRTSGKEKMMLRRMGKMSKRVYLKIFRRKSQSYTNSVANSTSQQVSCDFLYFTAILMHPASTAAVGIELPLSQFPWMGMCAILIAAGFILLNYPEGAPFPNEKQRGTKSKGIAGLPLSAQSRLLKQFTDKNYPLSFQGGHSTSGNYLHSYECKVMTIRTCRSSRIEEASLYWCTTASQLSTHTWTPEVCEW
jgi:hypothetical protein